MRFERWPFHCGWPRSVAWARNQPRVRPSRRVRRLYWVQFERYLPDNDHQYDYDDGETVQVGGLPSVSHSAPRRVDEPRPHSDGAYARGRA